MYQCLICLDVMETQGFCFCGRLSLDRKLLASGEYWIYLGARKRMNEKTHVNQCPHCGWKGLIIPKLAIGCPEHGVWWAKVTPNPPRQEPVERKDKTRQCRKDRGSRREQNKKHRK